MILLRFTGQDEYPCPPLSTMGKKKQKLVRHTAEQLTDAPPTHIHTASIYTFQSGKPLVRTESLTGVNIPPVSLHDEDPPSARNQFQIYDPGDFLEYMPIHDDDAETETSKRKRTAGVSIFSILTTFYSLSM